MNIPKKLWQIWIGPKPAPIKWMDSWKKHHIDWEYTLIDDNFLKSQNFINQHLIDYYINNQPVPASYAGAADLIKYEILYKYGGFIPEADSFCLHNTNELWTGHNDTCYTVYENEKICPGYVSPIFASNAHNSFLDAIISDLNKLSTKNLHNSEVYKTTGNEYLCRMINLHKPSNIKIFPSHYFIPYHFSSPNNYYQGNDKIYCEQYWGSTKNNYHQGVY